MFSDFGTDHAVPEKGGECSLFLGPCHPIGSGHPNDPVSLCYCFNYDRKDVRDDIRQKGDTDIQKIITERVRAGECRCEVTNPSGGCCLGTVSKEIKYAKALKDQDLLPVG